MASLAALVAACGSEHPVPEQAAPKSPPLDAASPGPPLQSYSTQALGGLLQISLVPGPDDPEPAVELAFAEARRIEGLLNLWDPESLLARWNASPDDSPTRALPVELATLLARSLELAELTGGAFDPTVATSLRELGFYDGAGEASDATDATEPPKPLPAHPTFADVRVELPASGEPATVHLTSLGTRLELDLSALAKGYAAERLAAILAGAGIPTARVSVGTSSIQAFGPGPPEAAGRGWPLELPHPDGALTWWLIDEASSTSGRLSLTLPGSDRSHILDGRTGEPVDHRTEMVVVRGPSASDCDLVSTALLVLGIEAGSEWLAVTPSFGGCHEALFYAQPETQGGPANIVHVEL